MQKINKILFDELSYDTKKAINNNKNMSPLSTTKDVTSSMSMFIFAGSDLNAAAYHLIQSLQIPNNAGIYVRELFIQESVQAEFIGIVQKQLKPYDNKIERSVEFLNEIAKIKPKIIMAENVTDNSKTPLLIFNLNVPSIEHGVVVTNIFRTAKEAIALSTKTNLTTAAATKVSIWHENHSCAYEIIVALKREQFFINCFYEALPNEVAKSNKSYALIENSYHFEMLENDGMKKTVVFPIGTIFAN